MSPSRLKGCAGRVWGVVGSVVRKDAVEGGRVAGGEKGGAG